MSEAEQILGAPESTIRRWIRQGRVSGEQMLRDPDNPRDTRMVWRVLVSDAPASVSDSEPVQPPPLANDPSGSRHDASEALRIAEDRLAFADTLIVANGESIARQDETIARLYAENAALIERAARADERAIAADRRADLAERERATGEARAADLAARLAAAEAERQRLADELARRRWWRWW